MTKKNSQIAKAAANATADASAVANATAESTAVANATPLRIPLLGLVSSNTSLTMRGDKPLFAPENDGAYILAKDLIARNLKAYIRRLSDKSANQLATVIIEAYYPKSNLDSLPKVNRLDLDLLRKVCKGCNLSGKESERTFSDSQVNRAWESAHRIRQYSNQRNYKLHTVACIVLGLIIPKMESSVEISQAGQWFKGYLKSIYGGASLDLLNRDGIWVSSQEASARMREQEEKGKKEELTWE